jgi:hypothetical protein
VEGFRCKQCMHTKRACTITYVRAHTERVHTYTYTPTNMHIPAVMALLMESMLLACVSSVLGPRARRTSPSSCERMLRALRMARTDRKASRHL